MSLKAFHIFFIGLASLMSLGCGVWGFRQYSSPDPRSWHLWFGVGGVLLFVALVIYGWSFLKKMKGVSYL